MQALVVTPGVDGSAAVAEMPVPRPGAGELLVRPLEVGVCGTDREIAEGLFGIAPAGEERLILGHEVLGRVEERGHGFAARRPRDRDRAPLLRALPRVRGGGARRVRDGRLQRARHHPPARLRRRARGRAGRAPRRGARGAARRRRARRAGLDLRARRCATRSRWAAASPGRRPARSSSARARSACSAPTCCGSRGWRSARPRSSRPDSEKARLVEASGASYVPSPGGGLAETADGFDIVIVAAASADLSLNVLAPAAPRRRRAAARRRRARPRRHPARADDRASR